MDHVNMFIYAKRKRERRGVQCSERKINTHTHARARTHAHAHAHACTRARVRTVHTALKITHVHSINTSVPMEEHATSEREL